MERSKLVNQASEFASQMSNTLYEIIIEGEFVYELEDYTREFAESIFDDPLHSAAIKKQIEANILSGISHEVYVPNEKGDFEYEVTMYDEGSFIPSYVTNLWFLKNK